MIVDARLGESVSDKSNLREQASILAMVTHYSSGLSPNSLAIMAGGYRAPFEPPTLSIAFRIFCSSSLDSDT